MSVCAGDRGVGEVTVENFTGPRLAPTQADIEAFHAEVDGLCEGLKKDTVTGYAVVVIDRPGGRHQLRTEWSKHAGVGLHELVGGALLLADDILRAMPEAEE